MASLQTGECILLGSTDVDPWSNVRTVQTDADQIFTIRTPLLTGRNAGCGRGNGMGRMLRCVFVRDIGRSLGDAISQG